jgi:hypothetical protein
MNTYLKTSNNAVKPIENWEEHSKCSPNKTLTWGNECQLRVQYLLVKRVLLASIILFGEYLNELHGDNIPKDELIALRRDLENHNELFGIGSEIHRRVMNVEIKPTEKIFRQGLN